MPPRRRVVLRRIGLAAAVVAGVTLLLAAASGLWVRGQLRASLPQLDGARLLEGLGATVRVERDALGVPTIRGAGRLDVARATGFLHAQDRFFQMDLQRRQAAGELAEILGPALIPTDRSSRLHRFRAVARAAIAAAPDDGRALIEAYTGGVNSGLAALSGVPFEYLLLRSDPAPWRPEDSVLVMLAMYLVLQDQDGSRESALGVMHDTLPAPLFEFLAPRGTSWDAPVIGEPFAMPPIPGPEVINLATGASSRRRSVPRSRSMTDTDAGFAPGSNNWAVAGRLTADGGALLANDMHLGLQMPNIWYRASFVWPDAARPDQEHRVTGVTLPGMPVIVAGSNGRVAWGFTNSYGDWNDLVVLEIDPADAERYRTPEGFRALQRSEERIRVKGQDDQVLEIVSSIWGPIIDRDHLDRPRSLRWLAHDAEGVNLEMRRLETADDLETAMTVAARSGTPAQNFVAAGDDGRIGWTILGRIPRRIGFDGRLPGSWADGSRRWDGWLTPAEYPRLIDPPNGRIWTANARVVDGAMLERIGDGGYDLGARAGQIRDALLALDQATPEAMLRIQLDDRALFLQRWRDLLLGLLTPEAVASAPLRGEFRKLVDHWQGRAAIDSAGFRMVRAYRQFLAERVFASLTAPCRAADERFNYGWYGQREGPLWRLVSERPAHLLDPAEPDWDALLLAGVDRTIEYFTSNGEDLAGRTWGERNTVRIQHPISLAVPALGRWLDMPAEPLPGASFMPRVQTPGAGASQRMVVSPGREADGIFHMPGGQSGHPLSPHYRDGHRAWALGEPTPFLPGEPIHILNLHP